MTVNFKPLSVTQFPEISTNCVGFALGIEKPVPKSSAELNLDEKCPISDAFTKKFKEFFCENLRKISSLEEVLEGEYVFMVFDFTKFYIKFYGYDDPIPYFTSHVIRRELNGTWVHKPGWDDAPCIITSQEEWEAIFEEFGRKYVLFAVKPGVCE